MPSRYSTRPVLDFCVYNKRREKLAQIEMVSVDADFDQIATDVRDLRKGLTRYKQRKWRMI